jgi:hypothetical protein
MPSPIPSIADAQSTAFSYFFSDRFIGAYGPAYVDLLAAAEASTAPRRTLTSADRADAYGALCWADDYLEAAKAALREGDDDEAAHQAEVLLGIAKVVAGKLRGSSSENLGILH